MYVASDTDLQASLRLADARYEQVQKQKEIRRRAKRKEIREALESRHLVEEKALRCASKKDKEAGTQKRELEKSFALSLLEKEQMAYEDETSRVWMALQSAKLQSMHAARQAHMRQFDDPTFHFVPRRKLIQIQSGCINTMCHVLDKNNRTNTWQTKDACVVEQCLSALALHIHRRPERCQELQETKGGVQAIATGMRECPESRLVQERGLNLIEDICLGLATCAEAFLDAGALETIVDGMARFRLDWRLQTCGCNAISAIIAVLPSNDQRLVEQVVAAGTHLAVGQALRRYPRSEIVLVAGMRTLETIALRCSCSGMNSGQACVQKSLLPSTHFEFSHFDGDENIGGGSDFMATPTADGRNIAPVSVDGSECESAESGGRNQDDAITDPEGEMRSSTNCQRTVADQAGAMRNFSQGRGEGQGEAGRIGATAFSLRVADSFSRDDSRTIVRRAGAARVAATAFNLLRALLTEGRGVGGESGEARGGQGDANEEGVEEGKNDDEEGVLAGCVEEFYEEQGVEILVSAMEHHVHDASLLLAAWQAMHSVIRVARRTLPKTSTAHNAATKFDGDGTSLDIVLARAGAPLPRRDLSEPLLRRGKNLEELLSLLARTMDAHEAVAPLQWICLVCLIDLHQLEARVSDMFMLRSGCQILNRCIRTNARHTAVVEQGCRAVAVMSEPSFTSRTRLFVEKVQDVIHEVVFLHKRHPGVNKLGNRALDALWGKDDFGAKQKASAAERVHTKADEGGDE